ncbi:hypothetical protein KBA01_20800 [Kozakia baliensis]|nr:hypothetical protein KBA01_20800 [Kozakia baliensis]
MSTNLVVAISKVSLSNVLKSSSEGNDVKSVGLFRKIETIRMRVDRTRENERNKSKI